MQEATSYENLSPFEKLAENCPLLVCGTLGVTGIFNFLNGETAPVHFCDDCICGVDGCCMHTGARFDVFGNVTPETCGGLTKRSNTAVLRVLECSKAMSKLCRDTFLIGGPPPFLKAGDQEKWRPVFAQTIRFCFPPSYAYPGLSAIATISCSAEARDILSAVAGFLKRQSRKKKTRGCALCSMRSRGEFQWTGGQYLVFDKSIKLWHTTYNPTYNPLFESTYRPVLKFDVSSEKEKSSVGISIHATSTKR